MTAHSPRGLNLLRRREKPRSAAMLLALSVATAAALGMIIYLTNTALPYLVDAAANDRAFGNLNQCVLDALHGTRVGFAVAADGSKVAAYSGESLVVCTRGAGQGQAAPRQVPLSGVVAAAFDFDGNLWAVVGKRGDSDAALWRVDVGGPARVGEVAPVSIVGHAAGVVTLDGAGKLASFGPKGEVTGVAELPNAPSGDVHMAVNADGTLVSVAAGTGVFVYRVPKLEKVYAEGACDVEYLWWLREPTHALVSCGPGESWALELDVESGAREAAPRKDRPRSTLVPKLGAYVQACNQLPCGATAP